MTGTQGNQLLTQSARRTWALLGDPAALSLTVTLLYLPITFVGPVLIDRQRWGGTLAQWATVGLAGQATLMVCFILTASVVARVGSRARPAATLTAFACAASCRGVALFGSAASFGFTSDGELKYRILNGIFVHSAILVCLAILVVSRDQHRRLIRILRDRQAILAELESTLQARLMSMRASMTLQVRQRVEQGLADLNAVLNRADPSDMPTAALAHLRLLLDRDVRPLSLALVMDQETEEFVPTPDPSIRVRVPLPDHLGLQQCLQPAAMTLVFTLGALSTAVLELSTVSLLLFAGTCLIFVFCLMTAVRYLLRSWCPRLWVAVSVTASLTMGVGALMPITLGGVGIPIPRFILLPSIIVGLIVGLATAGYAAVNARRAFTEELLRDAVDRLSQQVSVLKQGEWLVRRRLGYAVHGPLQSAIQVGIMQLSEGPQSQEAVLQHVQQEITDALNDLERIGKWGADPVSVMEDLAVVWKGICRMTWKVDPGAQLILTDHAMTSESAAEVIREGVGNAIWHGQSSRIDITVTEAASAQGNRLLVQIADDGVGCPPGAPEGLGSRLLDTLCLRWDRQSSPTGTVVTAEIAVPRPPASGEVPVP